jgi:type II secretory pathway component GspD/PulD (secretin)
VVFNRQRAENRLLVGDGETAVIGGLTVSEKSRVRTGIPILMNIPLLGRLFGQTTTSEIKRDLLILVTPHILDEGEVAPIPGRAAERRRTSRCPSRSCTAPRRPARGSPRRSARWARRLW